MKIGIISDTHGELQAEVFNLFNGVDHIWHAGDIGDLKVISDLEILASVLAVHGNMDKFPIVSTFPQHQLIEIAPYKIYLTHKYLTETARRLTDKDYSFDLNFNIIVCGHTHVPFIKQLGSVTYFNPGSATHPKNHKNSSVGFITFENDGSVSTEIEYFG